MSPRHTHYDMIFLGGGCAALSLLVRLLRSGHFSSARFLVIDRDRKKTNDRTWCFWEKGDNYFESVVYRKWEHLNFFSTDFAAPLQLNGYRYKMIRGVDFYSYCLEVLEQSGQVEWVEAAVTEVSRTNNKVMLKGYVGAGAASSPIELTASTAPLASDAAFTWHLSASLVFNSIYKPATTSARQIDLLQHFKGWIIETDLDTFDPYRATLMDFRVNQQEGATFVYVMPFSKRRALVEYTLFTATLLSPAAYEQGLRDYIEKQLGIHSYKVVEEEFGIIPMTTQSFSFYKDGIFNLGTAGGQTKASSGYTFQFIQKQSARIVQQLLHEKPLQTLPGDSRRFHFYDRVLLQVLAKGYWPGDKVFARLFARNSASQIFRFLDNETSLSEELSIISSLPTWPFLKAASSVI